MGAAYLVLVATVGITFSLQAVYSETRAIDWGVRLALAAMSLFILLSFNDVLSDIVSLGVLAAIAYWVVVRRPKLGAGATAPVAVDPALAASMPDAPMGRMS